MTTADDPIPLTKERVKPGARIRCTEEDGEASFGSIVKIFPDDHPSNPYPPDPRFGIEWEVHGFDWYWFAELDDLEFEVME